MCNRCDRRALRSLIPSRTSLLRRNFGPASPFALLVSEITEQLGGPSKIHAKLSTEVPHLPVILSLHGLPQRHRDLLSLEPFGGKPPVFTVQKSLRQPNGFNHVADNTARRRIVGCEDGQQSDDDGPAAVSAPTTFQIYACCRRVRIGLISKETNHLTDGGRLLATNPDAYWRVVGVEFVDWLVLPLKPQSWTTHNKRVIKREIVSLDKRPIHRYQERLLAITMNREFANVIEAVTEVAAQANIHGQGVSTGSHFRMLAANAAGRVKAAPASTLCDRVRPRLVAFRQNRRDLIEIVVTGLRSSTHEHSPRQSSWTL